MKRFGLGTPWPFGSLLRAAALDYISRTLRHQRRSSFDSFRSFQSLSSAAARVTGSRAETVSAQGCPFRLRVEGPLAVPV